MLSLFKTNTKLAARLVALIAFAPLVGGYAHGSALLYAFKGGGDGGGSHAGVILGRKGTIFGTTEGGGAGGWGTVFRIANGIDTPLYSFTGGSDGGTPLGGVIADKSGNLYGTTYGGGSSAGNGGCGVVYEVAPQGGETVLYTFTCGSDGGLPRGNLVFDKSGNLYGTTQIGGPNYCGTVFELTPARVETVLYPFDCGTDGAEPLAGLARDSAGNLYGTTIAGGTDGYGNVFKLAPDGTLTNMYSFAGGSDGDNPRAAVVLDSSGNVYGTTYDGGSSSCDGFGCGIVYKISPDGTETILHAFTGGSDGLGLYGSVYLDTQGNVYGTTIQGGSGCDYGCGTVFQISPSGNKTTVHAFTEAEGADSESGLVADAKGNLYGTAHDASTYGYGSVFKVKE